MKDMDTAVGAQTAAAIRRAESTSAERPPTPSKRTFTPAYKQRILREVDTLAASGERGAIGRLLRREGLYNENVRRWRAERDRAELAALQPRPRGPKPKSPEQSEIERLQRELERTQRELRKAEIIIDVQKKLSDLLGPESPRPDPDPDETP